MGLEIWGFYDNDQACTVNISPRYQDRFNFNLIDERRIFLIHVNLRFSVLYLFHASRCMIILHPVSHSLQLFTTSHPPPTFYILHTISNLPSHIFCQYLQPTVMPQYLSSYPIFHSLAFPPLSKLHSLLFQDSKPLSSPISQNARLTITGVEFSAFCGQGIKRREILQSHISGTKYL
jgi:hypothetical protein